MSTRHIHTLVIPIILVATMNLACKCCGSEEKIGEIVPKVPALSKGGASSIEKLGEELFKAGSDGDMDALMDLFPSDALADEALDCPGENPIIEAREEARADLVDEIRKMSEEGVKMEMLGVISEGDKEKFAVGDEVEDGCTAKKPLTITEAEFSFRMMMGGETEGEEEGFLLIQIGDGGNWYLIEDG